MGWINNINIKNFKIIASWQLCVNPIKVYSGECLDARQIKLN